MSVVKTAAMQIAVPSSPFSGLAGVTGVWSMSRVLVTGYAGQLYATTASNVSTLYDQSGTGTGGNHDFTDGGASGRRPGVVNTGPNSIPAAQFNGTSNYLETLAAISAYIAAAAAFTIISFIPRAIRVNNATVYLNDFLFGDRGQFSGNYLRNDSPTANVFNWDTAAKSQASVIALNTAYVMTLRHDSGVLYGGVNGVETAGVASGNTGTMTGVLGLCGRATQYSQSDVFEAATFNVVPSATARASLVGNFRTWIGA
jgi:hypothetical protein